MPGAVYCVLLPLLLVAHLFCGLPARCRVNLCHFVWSPLLAPPVPEVPDCTGEVTLGVPSTVDLVAHRPTWKVCGSMPYFLSGFLCGAPN